MGVTLTLGAEVLKTQLAYKQGWTGLIDTGLMYNVTLLLVGHAGHLLTGVTAGTGGATGVIQAVPVEASEVT